MANPVGSLVVRMGMDLTELKQGVAKAQGELGKLGKTMRTGINVAGKYAAAMAAAGAAVVTALVSKAFDAIDAQAKLARQLRATNIGLETLTRAADLAGVEQTKMLMAVRRLDVAIGESIRGTATYKDAFDALGLSAQSISEMDADERIKAINKALQETVPAAQQAQVAGVLFGNRVGVAVGSISADELARAREEVDALGLAVSEVDSNTIERLGDDISTLREVFRGLVNRIAVKLAPIVAAIAETMKKAAIESRGFEDSVTSAFSGAMRLAGGFGDTLRGLQVVFKGLELLVTGFGGTVATVFELAVKEVFGFASKVNSAVNSAIVQLNRLPKVDIELLETDSSQFGLVQFADDFGNAMREKTAQVRGDLHDLAMQEMPSDKIEAFIARVQVAADEASEAAEAARASMVGADPTDPEAETGDEAEARREALAGKLDALRSHLMDEVALEQKAHQDRFKNLQESLDEGLLEEGEYQKLKEEMTLQHQERIAEMTGKEEQARKEGIAARLEALQASMMTEAELELENNELKMETLREALEERLLTEEEYRLLREEAEKAHQSRMAAIEDEGQSRRLQFEKMSMGQKAKTIAGELSNITAGVAQHNRKLFELNKVAGIANAIIDAYKGISLTMSAYPYPINLGMAAAHAVAAFAQISAIKSASFGSGSAPSIAGSTPATPVSPVSSGTPSGGGGRIAIEGLDKDSFFSGSQVRDLAEKLQEHMKDGGTLVFV